MTQILDFELLAQCGEEVLCVCWGRGNECPASGSGEAVWKGFEPANDLRFEGELRFRKRHGIGHCGVGLYRRRERILVAWQHHDVQRQICAVEELRQRHERESFVVLHWTLVRRSASAPA